MNERFVRKAKELRGILHTIPEASMQEENTKEALMGFLQINTQLEINDLGKWFYAVHRAEKNAKTIAFRADFDAVTGADGVNRHLCGHDGHASVLAAYAASVSERNPNVNVIFLFQPGEESGEGAKLCMELFLREKVDEIYAFHNIPGYPLGAILAGHGTFACASLGLEIRMTGKPAHAAYPEQGINPASAFAALIGQIEELMKSPHRGIVLATVIGMELGSSRYGVSASEGTLRLTVRAERMDEFESFLTTIREIAAELAAKHRLKIEMFEHDVFPATENNPTCVENIIRAGVNGGLEITKLTGPFRWSEDFGHYLTYVPGAMFGIGSGDACPALHTMEYEFPDELIPYALVIFDELVTLHEKPIPKSVNLFEDIKKNALKALGFFRKTEQIEEENVSGEVEKTGFLAGLLEKRRPKNAIVGDEDFLDAEYTVPAVPGDAGVPDEDEELQS